MYTYTHIFIELKAIMCLFQSNFCFTRKQDKPSIYYTNIKACP